MFYRNLSKLLRAIDLLSSKYGTTVKEMQEKLGISRSSVYRLKNELEDLNFPIYEEKSKNERKKQWRLREDFVARLPNINLPLIQLTPKDIVLLNFLFSKAGIFKDSAIQNEFDILKEKLLKGWQVPGKKEWNSDKLERLFFGTVKFKKDYSQKKKIIDTLIDSIVSHNQCLIKYHSITKNKVSSFVIEPLRMFEHEGGLYIFANIPYYNNIRMLAVERIQYIKKQDKFFEYPEVFDAEKLINSSFGIILDEPVSVKIWFHASQAPYIKERKWAVNQKITDNPDGSVILSFTASSLFEIKKWILSYGKFAKVIEPKELADEIVNEIKSTIELYKETI